MCVRCWSQHNTHETYGISKLNIVCKQRKITKKNILSVCNSLFFLSLFVNSARQNDMAKYICARDNQIILHARNVCLFNESSTRILFLFAHQQTHSIFYSSYSLVMLSLLVCFLFSLLQFCCFCVFELLSRVNYLLLPAKYFFFNNFFALVERYTFLSSACRSLSLSLALSLVLFSGRFMFHISIITNQNIMHTQHTHILILEDLYAKTIWCVTLLHLLDLHK